MIFQVTHEDMRDYAEKWKLTTSNDDKVLVSCHFKSKTLEVLRYL